MLNDFLSRAHTHMFIIVPLNEGACFSVCLLSALLAALFALQTLCLICFNMLNIHPNGIVTMCTCSRDVIFLFSIETTITFLRNKTRIQ